ncbi:MAG: chorismate mutase [Anaerolineaceae bacterium]|jgi:chorismate mutase|nr:chorismate mutase [Anaerolineaceae bacterium]
MSMRGIRGATTVSRNDASAILDATQELLVAIQAANAALTPQDIASALFTLTPDLDAVYPAKAARLLGWTNVPLVCAQEIPVPGGLPLCIRVLLHWNTDLPQDGVHHIYLHHAVCLRPDISTSMKGNLSC